MRGLSSAAMAWACASVLPAIKTGGGACLRRTIPCTLNQPLWFAGWSDPRGPFGTPKADR